MSAEFGSAPITAEQAAFTAPVPVGEIQPGTTIVQSLPSTSSSEFPLYSGKVYADDPRLVREQLIRESPVGVLLSEISYSPDNEVFQTGRHEVMHGLINPSNVIAMSVVPKGNSLGRTFLRYVDDTTAAAGIVHGEGYGGDWTTIALRAMRDRRSVRDAVSSAVGNAQAVLEGYPDDVINLVACGLMQKKNVSGSEFRQLVRQAYRELRMQEKEETSAGEHDHRTERTILIDVHADGLTYSFFENGDMVNVVHISLCSQCGGEDGTHTPQCPTLMDDDTEKNKPPVVRENINVDSTETSATVTEGTNGIGAVIYNGNDPAKHQAGESLINVDEPKTHPEDIFTEIEKPLPVSA